MIKFTKPILIALATLAFGISANAAEFIANNLKFKVLEGYEVEIIGCTGELKGVLSVPETVFWGATEYRVVSIGSYAFQENKNITKVIASPSLKAIGYCSFDKSSVTSVDLQGVESIYAYAFSECAITELTIPASVKYIDNASFDSGTIKTLTFEDGDTPIDIRSGWGSFDCTSLETVYCGRPFNDTDRNFRPTDALNLKTVTFGDAVTFIPSNFAPRCTALTEINFSGNETEIGSHAFQGCTALPAVVIPDACKIVGYCAFDLCTSLADIVLNKAEQIHAYAFAGCSPISLFIPKSVVYIDNKSFDCKTIKDLVFEDHTTSIDIRSGWGSFDCTSLETVYCGRPFNDTDRNFRPIDALNLKTVTFGDAVTFIPASFANGCTALTEINFSGNETEIGSYAFQGCTALPAVVIPDACKIVGYCAFDLCTSLADITLNKAEQIHAYAFAGCSPISLFIPKSVVYIDNKSFDCKTIQELIFEDGTEPLEINDGSASINCTSLKTLYYGRSFNESGGNFRPASAKNLKTISIGKEATFIPGSFANGCDNLTEINFGGNEQTLGSYCFQNCISLEHVRLPDACTIVGYCSFDLCKALTSVILPANVKEIHAYAFTITDLTSIDSYAVNPPVLDNNAFSDVTYGKATVYVREGCVDAYKVAPNWKKFFSIEASGIEDITADRLGFELIGNTLHLNSGSYVSVYTVKGQLIYAGKDNVITLPHSGAYIIRANGKSCKVFTK